jgi:glycosyltransferase involved in cell wall biosynthesis
LLFVGRIHPKKGVITLLRAWHAVAHRFRDWELHIVGPDDGGHLTVVRELASELGLERLAFHGPLYGVNKLNAFRTADLFVLPTHSENFGISVAEALAAGTPAVVTVGAPWSRLPIEQAGWSIEIGLDPLVACLEAALASSPSQLAQMGLAGRRWMVREHSRRQIAKRHIQTYRWLTQGGNAPPWVMLS